MNRAERRVASNQTLELKWWSDWQRCLRLCWVKSDGQDRDPLMRFSRIAAVRSAAMPDVCEFALWWQENSGPSQRFSNSLLHLQLLQQSSSIKKRAWQGSRLDWSTQFPTCRQGSTPSQTCVASTWSHPKSTESQRKDLSFCFLPQGLYSCYYVS